MVELPPELWTHIARLLPTHEALRLMELNRAFLEVALDEKYKSLEMSRLSHQVVAKIRALR